MGRALREAGGLETVRSGAIELRVDLGLRVDPRKSATRLARETILHDVHEDPFLHLGLHRPIRLSTENARAVGEVLLRRADTSGDRLACAQKAAGRWLGITWAEYRDRCLRVAGGLARLGLDVGDRVAILGPTWIQWAVYDLGGLLAGLATVGIYPKQSTEQYRYLLEHSDSRVVFVSDREEMETLLESCRDLDSVQAIVPWTEELFDEVSERDSRIISPARFASEPLDASELHRRQDALTQDSTAVLVYTSGTTGPPKGAMISHGNILALLQNYDQIIRFYEDDLIVSFLPMAHVTERVLAFYGRIATGVPAAYATSVGLVIEELPEIRPTIFGSVPRIFEKLYARVQGEAARGSAIRRAIFRWAEEAGRRRIRRVLADDPIGPWLVVQNTVADRLVFRKIRAALGGRVRLCITGAAPIAMDILEFLWAIGLPVLEAYGMTEATVLTHINRLEDPRLGTVGQVIPNITCEIADDGEIVLQGPLVFQGYLKNPEATAEAVRGGKLYSGDIGVVDEDGFLRITDRKKHLIITAGGKNVAPANIECAIKMQSPIISQVHAHGDRRPYICALIAPSPLETLGWGEARGLVSAEEVAERKAELLADPASRSESLAESMAKVVADRRFREQFREAIREGNRHLARVEKVRRYFVLDRDLSQEGGEMTPTMKMKRRAIEEKYAHHFDRVYDDPDFGIDAEPAGPS
ncbi:MAG: long-chain fatty acid--CoA ligase [Thermoanaerobaculia bacterium]|nr:long-chain fatty acid--CoA ligase [Thermoanaerobaculia bacterium]